MDLHDAVYSLLTKVADEFYNPIPLIFAYQNAERRIKPYGTIRVDTIAIPQHELYLPVTHAGLSNIWWLASRYGGTTNLW